MTIKRNKPRTLIVKYKPAGSRFINKINLELRLQNKKKEGKKNESKVRKKKK
jgi:hypothetical protein